MPRFDGEGPRGNGMASGRGLGPCNREGRRCYNRRYGFSSPHLNGQRDFRSSQLSNDITLLERELDEISRDRDEIIEEIKRLKENG